MAFDPQREIEDDVRGLTRNADILRIQAALRKDKKMKYPIIILILTAAPLLPIASCTKGEAHAVNPEKGKPGKKAAGETKAPSAAVTNVKVLKLAPTRLVERVIAHGTTAPAHQVTYSAEIAGRIEHLSADLGDKVRRGQVLARIDFQTLKAQADQAESTQKLAEATHKRLEALKGEDLISQQQIDEARAQLVNARAQLAIARANLAKSRVTAARRGVVSARYAERSEYVGPGSRLYEVVDYRTIIVEAQVAESQIANVEPGAPAEVTIDALRKRFEGKIDAVIPTADRVSKTFTMRIEVDNPELEILVGMSAAVRVTAAIHDEVLAVPQSAVLEGRGERSVFVAADGVARKRTVRVGVREADRVVLLQGVVPDESLIVVGHRDLVDGQRIRVVD